MNDITTPALRLNVLRDASLNVDCTLGGVTSKRDRLTLIGYVVEPVREIISLTEGAPATLNEDTDPVVVSIRRGVLDGTLTARLVPLVYDGEREAWSYQSGHMAGGNYATTSDSRFTDLISDLLGGRFYGALAVHDRREH
ncbi:hypothetical protein ACT3TB_16415 [Micrococcaceae sp. AOP34-BR2-30]